MSLIRGVLLAGKFRTQHQLNEMSADDQRNTLIVEIAGRSKETKLQALTDDALAGIGAVLVLLRTARIRDDTALKGLTADDMRNTLIVELGAQTKLEGATLQGLSNIALVQLALGKPFNSLSPGSFIRGALLAGQFRTQHELNTMSADDMRNTLIVELAAHSNQAGLQASNDFELGGAGLLLVFLRGAGIRTDAQLKAISLDDQRNIAIVEIGAQTRLGAKLQQLPNLDLVLAALGVDPVFRQPLPPIRQPAAPSGDTAVFDEQGIVSDLPLGGSLHLVMRRSGDFSFGTHVHDSGFDNIDYVISAVLVTSSGIAFTFQHAGHVEGTSAGLPFGSPDRDDDRTSTGENPMITREFDGIFAGAKLFVRLDGKDKLVGGIVDALGDLLSEAAASLGKAVVAAAVALVV